MAPQKRKYNDADLESPVPHGPTRRSTRQHPHAEAGTEPADHDLRSSRARPSATDNSPEAEVTRPVSRGKESDTSNAAIAGQVLATSTKQPRTTRNKVTTEPQEAIGIAEARNTRPSTPPGARRRRIGQSKPSQDSSLSPSQPKPRLSSPSQHQKPPTKASPHLSRPIPAATGSGRAPPAGTASITPKRTASNKPKTPKFPGTPRSDRNIDKVVFGNNCFKAWYPSYYGKEILGDVPANMGAANPKIGGGKRAPPMLDRLYICPCCFKYSKEMVPWCQHVQYCERKRFVPGTKVYTHPRHSETVSIPRPNSASTISVGAVKGIHNNSKWTDGTQTTDEAWLNSGEWSVWEVDGDNEGLFCQNLSLFAKLFLDNKSVFFDVTGFNYFLLVYTPPHCESQPAPPAQTNSAIKSENSTVMLLDPPFCSSTSLQSPARPQIVGFFSKEKMSWDNNNLACILVFPPWQRKGLGALLMGVSYEISRREGILGGPEKPISELGRKGYKRFWAGEVVRWLLERDLPIPSSDCAHAARPATREMDKGKDKAGEHEELIVDVEQCSRDTWIAPEDCLAVLRDMEVAEEAGLGQPRCARRAEADGNADANAQGKEKEDKEAKTPLVHRVRIDKTAVRAWARDNKIELAKACDPRGFIEGYAIKRLEVHNGEE